MNAVTTDVVRSPVLHVHELPLSDREVVQRLLAKNREHFKEYRGSPREAYDAMTAKTPVADGVSANGSFGRVKGIWAYPSIAASDRAILFVHGGAFSLGSASGYFGLASQIAVRTSTPVFVLDYPLAPEYPFPAAYDAVVEACEWLGKEGFKRIAMIGDSAGGGLVLAALATRMMNSTSVTCAVTFSPWTDLSLASNSANSLDARDPIFKKEMLASAASIYLSSTDPKDMRASAIYGIRSGLPPIAIQVGENELLFDDSMQYAERAAQAGNLVTLDVYRGLHHVFQRSVHELSSARSALDRAAAFVNQHW